MKQVFAGIGIFILIIVVFAGLSFGFGWFGVGYTRTVGKAQENANRTVFEQTQSYVEGKRQDISKYMLEYKKDTSRIDREAIKSTILDEFANFDESKLYPDQQQFLDELRGQ